METFGLDSEFNLVKLKSKLEFPIDAVLLGGEASIGQDSKGKRNWSVELGIFTNLNDPGNVMKDHDWFTGTTDVGYFDGKFSYTESKAEMTHTVIAIKGEKRIASSKKFALYGYAGYRYQKISQDIIGYDGWQIDIFNDPSFTKVYGGDDTVKALLYEVTYKGPFLGVEYDYYFTPSIYIGIEAAAMPTSVSDYDNHLLRKKDGKAEGTGVGFLSSVFMHLEPWRTGPSTLIFFDIEGELFTARVSTKQVQEWYGDDPFSEDDDTGVIIRNIPHDVRSTQFNLGLRIGVTF
ncbi:MAG: hypothetical protein JSU69_04915 [Candidatus Zixiibacteriota bacterium]|nr:MAG: hypothetical protein JSU69_04915 [candidate division Zixibacteria bacterium]